MSTNAELQAQIDTINTKLAAAGVDGFGSPPVDGGGGEQYPSEPVNPSGSVLPWNPQVGNAGDLVFRGKTDYTIQPPAGYTGMREISLSQLAPQYDMIGVRLDSDATDVQGSPFIASATFPVWFADGAARTLHLTPTGNEQAAGGCGRAQLVGGA